MGQTNSFKVEVAYASKTAQRVLTVTVQAGSTIREVIAHSGILALFPEIDLTRQKVGIFSKTASLSQVVNEGDRIEIYRPLLIDPMEKRRRRART